MPCARPDCRHKPKRLRAEHPLCQSCARSKVLSDEAHRALAGENMAKGRTDKALTSRGLTPERAETLSYIRGLIIAGKPWTSTTAAADLGIHHKTAENRLYLLRHSGLVKAVTVRAGKNFSVLITIDGLGTTPAPGPEFRTAAAKYVPLKSDWRAEEERLEAARITLERERTERRTALLMQEHAPKCRAERILDGAEAAIARAYGF